MVVYVSPAEKNGGILQFSITMLKETIELRDAELFLPDSVENKYYSDISEKVIPFQKTKTLNCFSKQIRAIAERIISRNPECVVFLEDSILMQQLNYYLVREQINTAIVVHDVIHHPYRNMTIRAIVVDIIRRLWMRKTVKQDNTILLLSNNSKKMFGLKYNDTKAKLVTMTLGAHVPNVKEFKPTELPQMADYYLFFGRIDKYKGIADLCQAYTSLRSEIKDKHKLVIAGNGAFSELEKELIGNDDNIHTLNRFIEDGEMNWLYSNAKAIVLPYIEASQSGVLPIAYHFSKPVIVSNQEGLRENLKHGKTGYAYQTTDELRKCLELILSADMGDDVFYYYEERFDWKKNICGMLEDVNCGKNKISR